MNWSITAPVFFTAFVEWAEAVIIVSPLLIPGAITWLAVDS